MIFSIFALLVTLCIIFESDVKNILWLHKILREILNAVIDSHKYPGTQ